MSNCPAWEEDGYMCMSVQGGGRKQGGRGLIRNLYEVNSECLGKLIYPPNINSPISPTVTDTSVSMSARN